MATRPGVHRGRHAAFRQPVQHLFDTGRAFIGGDEPAPGTRGLRNAQSTQFADDAAHGERILAGGGPERAVRRQRVAVRSL
jgi:hypothetical protein